MDRIIIARKLKHFAQLMRAGFCDVLMYQDPRNQGYQALMNTFRILSDHWTPERSQLFTSTQIVVSENLFSFTAPQP